MEAPGGAFATALPCLPGEPKCDPSGTNVVRNDDGVHLCRGTAPDPCRYSSGVPLAAAIADAVEVGSGAPPAAP